MLILIVKLLHLLSEEIRLVSRLVYNSINWACDTCGLILDDCKVNKVAYDLDLERCWQLGQPRHLYDTERWPIVFVWHGQVVFDE